MHMGRRVDPRALQTRSKCDIRMLVVVMVVLVVLVIAVVRLSCRVWSTVLGGCVFEMDIYTSRNGIQHTSRDRNTLHHHKTHHPLVLRGGRLIVRFPGASVLKAQRDRAIVRSLVRVQREHPDLGHWDSGRAGWERVS